MTPTIVESPSGLPDAHRLLRSRLSWLGLGAGDMRRRVRWFAAEFLVVVTGVLVALALQAWYQHRQDHNREHAYLRQIAAELTETERRIAHADSLYLPGEHGLTALLAAYYARETPTADSIATWIWAARRYRAPAPVTETVEALVNTGDLRLVRSDSLRAAILGYAGAMRYLIGVQQRHLTRFNGAIDRLIGTVSFAAVRSLAGEDAELDDDARETLFPLLSHAQLRASPFDLDPRSFMRNRETYASLEILADVRTNLATLRNRLFGETVELHRRLDTTNED